MLRDAAAVLTLVGLSGTGKTTVAHLLAERWAWDACDLDAAVVREAGLPIPRIFDELGESAFRRLERDALSRALRRRRCVIAAGAGAPSEPGAMDEIEGAGPSVWLRGRPETLAARLAGALDRPLLGEKAAGLEETLAAQLAARGPTYARASWSIHTDDRSPDAVADAVENLFVAGDRLP